MIIRLNYRYYITRCVRTARGGSDKLSVCSVCSVRLHVNITLFLTYKKDVVMHVLFYTIEPKHAIDIVSEKV